jgi:hypothetical protein
LWQEYRFIHNEPIEPNDISALAVSFSTSLHLSAKDRYINDVLDGTLIHSPRLVNEDHRLTTQPNALITSELSFSDLLQPAGQE